jgi:hypothetical protein
VIRDSIVVAASPAQAWAVVAEPDNLPRWNPKVVRVHGAAGNTLREGSEFWITYRMNGRHTDCLARVTALLPQVRLELSLSSDRLPLGGSIAETYDVEPVEAGVRVTQTVRFKRSGVPWWTLALITVIHRVGRPTGKPYLERLRDLVEGRSRLPAADASIEH